MAELKTIAGHAGTILVGQLAVMAYSVTDTIVAGRYSGASLAALSVGSAIFVSVFVALQGVIQALLPVWAEIDGAGNRAALGRSFRQALYVCAITSAIGMLVLFNTGPVMEWARVPLAVRPEAQAYLSVLAWSLPPALVFRMFSTLNQSIGQPLLVTWLQIGSLVVKVPLSIWFAFGGFGLTPRGAEGCALATLVVNFGLCAVAIGLIRMRAMYRPYAVWQALEKPSWSQISAFFRLGVPTALAIMVEVTSFTLMALLIARMGEVAASSHQIAINLTALLYMVPLAISIAASSRVSFWLGAGEANRARHAIKAGFLLVTSSALILCSTLWIARAYIAGIYSDQPQIIMMTTALLAWVSAYHFFDAVQTICLFTLRSFKIAFVPFLIYALFLWGGGLGGGYWLAYDGLGPFAAMNTPSAFWVTSVIALMATTLAFLALLAWTLKLTDSGSHSSGMKNHQK